MSGPLSTHSLFIMVLVRHDFYVIIYITERLSDRRLLKHDFWGNIVHEGRADAWTFWPDFKISGESRPWSFL